MDPRSALIIIALLALVGFLVAFVLAPVVGRWLVAHAWWKKKVRTVAPDGSATPLFAQLHKDKETNTPRGAGIIFWGAVVVVALAARGAHVVAAWLGADPVVVAALARFDFINRSQTWIPLFVITATSLIGLLDDYLVVGGFGIIEKGGGIKFRHRILAVTLVALVGAYWFHIKLGWDILHVPFVGDVFINGWYIPLFVLVLVALNASSVVDGIDGLAGGIFAMLFATFAAIAFARGQFFLSAFCAVLAGALIAFVWFNIPPARFYMGETGIFGLTVTLGVVAFFTNTVLLLPLAGIVLVIEAGSVALQLTWKRIFKHKLFLIAPYHHHLEAKGWPSHRVTMRLWLLTGIMCLLTLVLATLDLVLK